MVGRTIVSNKCLLKSLQGYPSKVEAVDFPEPGMAKAGFWRGRAFDQESGQCETAALAGQICTDLHFSKFSASLAKEGVEVQLKCYDSKRLLRINTSFDNLLLPPSNALDSVKWLGHQDKYKSMCGLREPSIWLGD